MSRDIGTENCAVLRALADTLVPAGNGMPPASGADVAESAIEGVLNVRPDIFAGLVKALGIARGLDTATALEVIPKQDGEAWQTLRFAVLGVY